MQRIIEIVFRIFGGFILVFFAIAPSWILFHLAKTLIFDPSDLDITAAIAFLVCVPLLYVLLLLAYRAFTGQGRKQDGGLLPPWALKMLAITFGVLAVAIIVFGFYQNELRPIVGGLGYLVSAAILYRVVKQRESSKHDA